MKKLEIKELDIQDQFNEKINELEKELPEMKGEINCASVTFTNILNVLGLDNFYFHNLIVPLAGGFGGFKSINGWQGPCGAVSGACAAIGIITAGQERLKFRDNLKVYQYAKKFCQEFEKQFGSVICAELCGTDFSDFDSVKNYFERNMWKNQCSKQVIFAIDRVRELASRELKKKWQKSVK